MEEAKGNRRWKLPASSHHGLLVPLIDPIAAGRLSLQPLFPVAPCLCRIERRLADGVAHLWGQTILGGEERKGGARREQAEGRTLAGSMTILLPEAARALTSSRRSSYCLQPTPASLRCAAASSVI